MWKNIFIFWRKIFYGLLIILLNKIVTQHVITVSDNIKHLFKTKLFWTTLEKAIAKSHKNYCRKQHFKSIIFFFFFNSSSLLCLFSKPSVFCRVIYFREEKAILWSSQAEAAVCVFVMDCRQIVWWSPAISLKLLKRAHECYLGTCTECIPFGPHGCICSRFPTKGIHKTMCSLFVLEKYRHLYYKE